MKTLIATRIERKTTYHMEYLLIGYIADAPLTPIAARYSFLSENQAAAELLKINGYDPDKFVIRIIDGGTDTKKEMARKAKVYEAITLN